MFKLKKEYQEYLNQALVKIESSEPTLKKLTTKLKKDLGGRSFKFLYINFMHPTAVKHLLAHVLRGYIFKYAFEKALLSCGECEQNGVSMIHLERINRRIKTESDAALRVSKHFDQYVS